MEKSFAVRAALLLFVLSCLLVAVVVGFAGATPNLQKILAAQHELATLRPADPQVFNDLGNLLVLAGRELEAETAYRRAIELRPAITDARFNLAILMQQDGRLGEAMSELQQLIEIAPFDGWAHYQLGVVLAERGERAKAIEHYARAFAYDAELTFASANPHIIDNPLFTEALLHSKNYRVSGAARTPRQYSDPERIAGMMLDSEDDEEKGATRKAVKGTPKARQGKKGKAESEALLRSQTRVEDDEDEESDEGESQQAVRRTVTPKDVSTRPRTSASGSTATRPSSSSAPVGPGSALDRQKALERFRALRSRAPGNGSSGSGTSEEGGGGGQARVPPPSSPATRTQPAPRERYRPGTSSTGRLELKLLPLPGGEGAERYAAVIDPVG